MYNPFQSALRYLQYLITASNGQGHGVHSPFVFDFIIKVLNDRQPYPEYAPVEKLRSELKRDDSAIEVADLGAGSRKNASALRSVASIARSALKPPRYAQLLFRIAQHYQCRRMVELGTSLGLTSAYLSGHRHAEVLYTLEGAPGIAALAETHFSRLNRNNIVQVTGNFDDTLSSVLAQCGKVDLLYIDGNHRYAPTIRYFEQALPSLHDSSIVIFDDIHWSAEMEKAWRQIIADQRVTLSIDLFFIGLVFFRKEFRVKQHFTIRF